VQRGKWRVPLATALSLLAVDATERKSIMLYLFFMAVGVGLLQGLLAGLESAYQKHKDKDK
jgi:hypothetical protein